MTWLQPASLSIAAAISPVWAPDRAAWQSWPPTAMPLPASASATARSRVAGGHTRRSQAIRPRFSRCARSAAKASPSDASPFIFQLPAMSLHEANPLSSHVIGFRLAQPSRRRQPPRLRRRACRLYDPPPRSRRNPPPHCATATIDQAMLSAIRSKASSLPVKLLFGLLVVAFAIWGIGDIFRNRGADTTIATVGSRKIDQRALVQAVNDDAERLRGMFGGTRHDPEQLKQFGIVDNALQSLINRDLVDLEVDHLGLAVSNGAIGQAIRSNRAFLDEKGQFDPNRYKAAVANQRMTVPQFESLLRGDMVRQHLSHAIIAGFTPPPELVDTLYRSRAEHRVAEVAIVLPSAVGDPGTPDDADLAAFYDKH